MSFLTTEITKSQCQSQNLDGMASRGNRDLDEEFGLDASPSDAAALSQGLYASENDPFIEIVNLDEERRRLISNFRKVKFLYEETENPDEFFLPYIWTTVVSTSSTSLRYDSLYLDCYGRYWARQSWIGNSQRLACSTASLTPANPIPPPPLSLLYIQRSAHRHALFGNILYILHSHLLCM